MFCPNCGKQIDDDSVFCEFCGSKIEPLEQTPNVNPVNNITGINQTVIPQPVQPKAPMSKKTKMSIIIGVACAVAVIVAFVIYSVVPKTIKLDKFVSFESSGYDGYGEVYADFDWDAFEKEYGSKISLTNQAKQQQAFLGYYGNPVDLVNDYVSFDWNHFGALSNGDEVVVNIIVDEELPQYVKNKFTGLTCSFVVSGLEELTKIDILSTLNEPYVTFRGPNSLSYPIVNYKEKGFSYTDNNSGLIISVDESYNSSYIKVVKDNQLITSLDFIVEEDGPFSNGDTVTLRLADVSSLLSLGYSPAEDNVKVTVENRPELITDKDAMVEDSIKGYIIKYIYLKNKNDGYKEYSDHCYRNEECYSAYMMKAKESTITDAPVSVLIDFGYEYVYPGYKTTYTTQYYSYMLMKNPYIDNNEMDCVDYETNTYSYSWYYDNIADFIEQNSDEYEFIQIF